MWEKGSIIMHCWIALASPHLFEGKRARVFEGSINAGTLISHFSSLQAPVTQVGFFVTKYGLLFQKKKMCDDDKLEIICLFHGLHVKQKIKSSNPLFGLFVSF